MPQTLQSIRHACLFLALFISLLQFSVFCRVTRVHSSLDCLLITPPQIAQRIRPCNARCEHGRAPLSRNSKWYAVLCFESSLALMLIHARFLSCTHTHTHAHYTTLHNTRTHAEQGLHVSLLFAAVALCMACFQTAISCWLHGLAVLCICWTALTLPPAFVRRPAKSSE